MKIRVAFVFAMISCVASAATTPPKVVFIGDYITANWKSAFTAHPNWINKGVNIPGLGAQTSYDLVLQFQTDVVSEQPDILHILIGAGDVQTTDPKYTQDVSPYFVTNLDSVVQQAIALNIKVILGITPGVGSKYDYLLPQINSAIAAYGAANNIQVVNYGDALCQCVGALGQPTDTPNTFQKMVSGANLPAPSTLLPTTAGYALMTSLAETAVANEHLTLKSGYLQNVAMANANIGLNPGGLKNVQLVEPGAFVQFTPMGVYSDGSVHPQRNTTWGGASGTWTSVNPLSMSVNQQGLAFATTSLGNSIGYTSANGIKFSSWFILVQPAPPQ